MDLSSVFRRFVGFFVFYLPIAFKAVPVIGYYILYSLEGVDNAPVDIIEQFICHLNSKQCYHNAMRKNQQQQQQNGNLRQYLSSQDITL